MPQHAGPFAIANAAETLARGAATKLWWETATCSRVPVEICKSTSFCEYSEILVPVWNMLHVGTHCEIERYWKIAIWIRNQEQNSYTPHHDAQQRVRQHMRQKRRPQNFTAECCRYIMIYLIFQLISKLLFFALSVRLSTRPQHIYTHAKWPNRANHHWVLRMISVRKAKEEEELRVLEEKDGTMRK